MSDTGRSGTRRRGAELEQAVLAAALDELGEVGFAGLTIDGVAARAGTGKAALYRRWSSKHDLVLDALRDAVPHLPTPTPGAPVRDNLRAMLTTFRGLLAGDASFPALTVMADLLRHPDLRAGFDDRIVRPRLAAIEQLLADARRSGEIPADGVGPLAALAGPAMIVHWLLVTGRTPTDDDIDRIVDTVLVTGHG